MAEGSTVDCRVQSSVPESFNAASYFVDRHLSEGRGEKVAIECGDDRVTYGDFHDRVNRVGSALRAELQVRMEERVLLLLLDSPEMLYCFFGVMKIGAVPVPLNTLWRPSELEFVLNDSRARVLIIGTTLLQMLQALPRERLPFLEHVVVVGETLDVAKNHRFDDLLSAGSPTLAPALTRKDDAALWLYSSGSTGSPKGCIHLHRSMPFCAATYGRNVLSITAEDRFYSVAKIFFAYGLGNSVSFPFAVGATTILWGGPSTAPNVYGVIERHRPTLFFSVPTNFGMLLAHQRDGADFDLSRIRHAVSAGEALPPALFDRFQRRFGIEILDGIGSTEALHMFISNRPGHIRVGSSGLVVPGYEARLVDDRGEAVARGETGNLLISGDSICAAYWNQRDRTKATIEGQWIRTGDKYSQDEDEFWWYAGRSDDMLKVGGIWVSPIEVENVLIEHDAVLECAVVGRPDHDELIKPAAYVVLAPEQRPSEELAEQLQQYVRERLSDYKRPRWVTFLPELPKTATGKIQRFKLRALEEGGGKPRTEIEKGTTD